MKINYCDTDVMGQFQTNSIEIRNGQSEIVRSEITQMKNEFHGWFRHESFDEKHFLQSFLSIFRELHYFHNVCIAPE